MMCQVCPRGEEEYIQGLRIMKEHFVRGNGREFSITGASHGEVRMEPAQGQGQGVVVGPEEGWRGGWSSDSSCLSPHTLCNWQAECPAYSSLLLPRHPLPPPPLKSMPWALPQLFPLKTAVPGSPSTSPPPLLHFEGFQNPGCTSFFVLLTYRHLFPPSSFAHFCCHELFITAPPSKS